MKKENPQREKYRQRMKGTQWESTAENGNNGAFALPYCGIWLFCIVSDELGWDHISISLLNKARKTIKRTPTWEEMEHVKRFFFAPDEVVIQLHVAEEDHLSIHDYVLHLWRKQDYEIPLPPKEMV